MKTRKEPNSVSVNCALCNHSPKFEHRNTDYFEEYRFACSNITCNALPLKWHSALGLAMTHWINEQVKRRKTLNRAKQQAIS